MNPTAPCAIERPGWARSAPHEGERARIPRERDSLRVHVVGDEARSGVPHILPPPRVRSSRTRGATLQLMPPGRKKVRVALGPRSPHRSGRLRPSGPRHAPPAQRSKAEIGGPSWMVGPGSELSSAGYAGHRDVNLVKCTQSSSVRITTERTGPNRTLRTPNARPPGDGMDH